MKPLLWVVTLCFIGNLNAQQNEFYFQLRPNSMLLNPAMGALEKVAEIGVVRNIQLMGFYNSGLKNITNNRDAFNNNVLIRNNPNFLSLFGAVSIKIKNHSIGTIQFIYNKNNFPWEEDEIKKIGLGINIIHTQNHVLKIGMNGGSTNKIVNGRAVYRSLHEPYTNPPNALAGIEQKNQQYNLDHGLYYVNSKLKAFAAFSIANTTKPTFQFKSENGGTYQLKSSSEFRLLLGKDFNLPKKKVWQNTLLLTKTSTFRGDTVKFPILATFNSNILFKKGWDAGINFKWSDPKLFCAGLHIGADIIKLAKKQSSSKHAFRIDFLTNFVTNYFISNLNYELSTRYLF